MKMFETMHEAFKEQKLFCPTPTTRYYGSMVGMEVFWPFKDLSLNDELDITMLDYDDLIMDGANNFSKKRVSCKDDSLPNGLRPEKNFDLRIWVIQFRTLCNEELCGEGSIPLRIICKALHAILVLIQ